MPISPIPSPHLSVTQPALAAIFFGIRQMSPCSHYHLKELAMGSSPEFTLVENIAGFASWAFGSLVILGVAGVVAGALRAAS